MIKRALALALLLTAGFLLLQVALGDAAFGSFESGQRTRGRKGATSAPSDTSSPSSSATSSPVRPNAHPGAISLGGGGGPGEHGIRAGISGGVNVKRRREVPMPLGGSKLLTVYQVISEKTTPLPDDRYRLEKVVVHFFDLAGTAAEPTEELAGTLHASTLFLTLGSDSKGERSLKEDKELELFDSVLTTTDKARAKNLTMTLGHAFVLTEDAGTRVRSATDDEPFEVLRPAVSGETGNDLTLTGRGATAWLPAARGAHPAASRRMELRAKSEPVLLVVSKKGESQSGTSRLAAHGPLFYEEDLDRGAAHVLLEQEVVFSDEAHAADAKGDRLEGWLVRAAKSAEPKERAARAGAKQPASPSMIWRRIELTGEHCELTAKGSTITSTRVDIVPNPEGEPRFVAATGGAPRLVRKESDGRILTVDARDGIRLVRVVPAFGSLFSAFGLPRSALGARFAELVWFDGPSRLIQGNLDLVSDEGMTLLRGVPLGSSEQAELSARGAVTIKRNQLQLSGDHGLHAWSVGDEFRLHLESPGGQIVADLAPRRLEHVQTLEVRLHGNELRSLHAEGEPCRISDETKVKNKTQTMRGTATHVDAPDPSTMILSGGPAHVERMEDETLDADKIYMLRINDRHSIVDARGTAKLHFDQSQLMRERKPDSKTEPGDLSAERIVVLPYLVPKEIRGLHGSGLGRVEMALFAHDLACPYLVADRNVVLDQPSGQRAHATGEHLVLRLSAPEGEMTGAPARITMPDEHGQDSVGEARRLCFRLVEGQRILRLFPVGDSQPRLVVGNGALPAQAGAGVAPAAAGRLEVVSKGEILITPDKITFAGGSHVRSLLASGAPDANGLSLSSRELSIDRDEKAKVTKRIYARGDVVIDNSQLHANSDEASLDPVTHWCQMRDARAPGNVVSIRFENGWKEVSPRIEFNWQTAECRSWRGGLERPAR